MKGFRGGKGVAGPPGPAGDPGLRGIQVFFIQKTFYSVPRKRVFQLRGILETTVNVQKLDVQTPDFFLNRTFQKKLDYF